MSEHLAAKSRSVAGAETLGTARPGCVKRRADSSGERHTLAVPKIDGSG
jgi:hypothetical protein